MDHFTLSGVVQRFPGPKGWHYLELPEALDAALRPVVRARWPGLVGVDCAVGAAAWRGAILPVKGGFLFITLPAKVRARTGLDVGDAVTLTFTLAA